MTLADQLVYNIKNTEESKVLLPKTSLANVIRLLNLFKRKGLFNLPLHHLRTSDTRTRR